MHKIKSILLSVFALASTATSFAQTGTDSPYTRYGYGQLSESGFGASRAMGGAALGTRNNNRINPANPASYSAIDSTTFLFDFGVSGQMGYFKEGSQKASKYNGNIDYIAMQFPISKGIGASVGIIPFSNVGYQFGDSIKVTGQTSYIGQTSYYGNGGFSQAYVGFAGKLSNHISAGVNLNYFFGTINHTRQTIFTSGATSDIISNQIRARGLKTDFGLQIFSNPGKESNFSLGLKYSPKTKLNTTATKMVYLVDTTTLDRKFELPETYGAGLALQLNKKWSVAVDGLYQKWADVEYYSTKDTLNNKFRISAGAEFTPNSVGRYYYERVRYRFGAYYSNNYLNVKNSKLNEYGVSVGLGLPFKTSKSQLNISVEYSRLQPEFASFVKENYLKFTLNMTFNEFWFFKRKLD